MVLLVTCTSPLSRAHMKAGIYSLIPDKQTNGWRVFIGPLLGRSSNNQFKKRPLMTRKLILFKVAQYLIASSETNKTSAKLLDVNLLLIYRVVRQLL